MDRFSSFAEVKTWAEDHTGPECVALYNSIEGVKKVARFENREIAANRIWKALVQPIVEQVAATPAPAAEVPQQRAEDKPKKAPKKAAPKAKAQRKAKATRAPKAAPSKDGRVAAVTALVSRANGVKLTELMTRFGWLAHTARGFMSTLASKHGVQFESFRNDQGERVYKGL
jgi:hypothetical protein